MTETQIKTPQATASLTPMMQQYRGIKQSLPEGLLLYRMGDFYELFFEDAVKAAGILNITLTGRESGAAGRVPMCGMPFHAAENYIAKLVAAGNKVAICDQVEDPKLAKGLVKREVTRVITPGTVLEQNLLDQKAHNYLVCVAKADRYGLAMLDLSTGQFRIAEMTQEADLAAEMHKIRPSELLLPKDLAQDPSWCARVLPDPRVLINAVEPWQLDAVSGRAGLQAHFGVATLDGFGASGMDTAVGAAGLILRYVKDNRYDKIAHVRTLQTYSTAQVMVIDAVSQRNLELVQSLADGSREATLLQVLDKTVTAMGARALRDWILNPLLSLEKISRRQEAVEELTRDNTRTKGLREALESVSDLERLHARLSCGFGNARDLAGLRDSLAQLPKVRERLDGTRSHALGWIAGNLPDLHPIVRRLQQTIVETPPISLREGGFIQKGFHAELDELREVSAGGHAWLVALQRQESERTGIKSLKVRYNKVFGYYIDVSKANLAAVPAEYIRKQTLVNSERFITPELKEHEAKMLGAEERAQQLEYELFGQLRQEVLGHAAGIAQAAGMLAGLDCLLSLATVALNQGYVRPGMEEGDVLEVREGRHPVLETMLQNCFIPNDVRMDTQSRQLLLITGPNMAGKSTYIRQVALLVLMAHVGSFIPAKAARIGLVDRIFTRVGASDALAKGMSTFMVEMSEAANILNNATARSLIILDEIGRGTSTFDGLSIAWAVCEYLHNNKDKKAKTLFATHYHELTELEGMFAGIQNLNVAVQEGPQGIVFLHKIVPGATDKSYGIHVAKLAGLPEAVLRKAGKVLRDLEQTHLADRNRARQPGLPLDGDAGAAQRAEQEAAHPVLEELRELKTEQMTPMAALETLHRWRNVIASEAKQSRGES